MFMRYNHKELIGGDVFESLPKNQSVEILKVAYAFDNMTAMKFEEEPVSEIAAIKRLMEEKDVYDEDVVNALVESINILNPGVCVEMTNGDKGLVIVEGVPNILEPYVLSFRDNQIYNLGDKYISQNIQIKDVMKTMDNRHVVNHALLKQYEGKIITHS